MTNFLQHMSSDAQQLEFVPQKTFLLAIRNEKNRPHFKQKYDQIIEDLESFATSVSTLSSRSNPRLDVWSAIRK